jgi:putative addiction module component (TIGR02574 family)
MKRDAAEILKDALALPIEERAALAGSLLESLDTEVNEDAEAVWATEVNRRVAELDSGAVKTVPWAEVRRRLAARWTPSETASTSTGITQRPAVGA